jgi:hypothetical protein
MPPVIDSSEMAISERAGLGAQFPNRQKPPILLGSGGFALVRGVVRYQLR